LMAVHIIGPCGCMRCVSVISGHVISSVTKRPRGGVYGGEGAAVRRGGRRTIHDVSLTARK